MAKFLFLDEGTIANYRRRYKEGGIMEMIFDIYSGRHSYLTDEERAELSAHLTQPLPHRRRSRKLYKKRFGVE
jgi:hypothetical protein